MYRETPLIVGENYHIFNRGAHKQAVFKNSEDYRRFLILLHLCNNAGRVNIRDLLLKYKGRSFVEIFEGEKTDHSLVDLFAYSLMPNHFHLVLRGRAENGTTSFLKKVLTGYSMYFNTKYSHSGVLFQGRFKSSHIDTEPYFRYIFTYVHLNSLDLFESGWEERGLQNITGAHQHVNNYPYSSFIDYSVSKRPESHILSLDSAPDFLVTQNDLNELMAIYTKDRPLYKEVGIK